MHRFHPFLVCIYLLSLVGCTYTSKDTPKIEKGKIDLSQWNFEKDGEILLDGAWEFYWQELISPQDFSSTNNASKASFAKVPSSWTNLTNPATNHTYPKYGCATYRLQIKLPKNHPHLSIFIPKIWTSTRIWMNEEMIHQSGIVNKSSKEAKAKILEKLVEIYTPKQEIDLIVQVSNYEMFLAGLLQGFRIGAYTEIVESISLKYSWTLMWLGILFAMGVYHFILFFFRRKRRSTFYFGIICILLGIRLMIFGDHYFYEYLIEHIGWLSFAIQSKVYYSTTFILLPVSLLYIESLYLLKLFTLTAQKTRRGLKKLFNQFHKLIFPIALGITGLYIIFIIIAPPSIFLSTIFFYQPVILIQMIYLIFLMFGAILRRENESNYQIIGMVVMILAAANDGLHQLGYEILGAFEIMPVAFVIFLSLQFLVLG